MKGSRRDFIKTSTALSVITVTRAVAQADPKKIALVVTTNKKDKHEAAMLRALSDYRWHPRHPDDKHANGKYDKIKDDAKDVYDKVDLIVAAGALPAAIAVATVLKEQKSSTPFIFLIGRYPQSASGDDADAADLFNSKNKAGGVDMNVPAQLENNFKQLRDDHGVSIDKVGLILNRSNPFSIPELTAWQGITGIPNQPPNRFIYYLETNDQQGLRNLL